MLNLAAGSYLLSSWPWMGLASGRPFDEGSLTLSLEAGGGGTRKGWVPRTEKEGARVAEGLPPSLGVLGSLFHRLLCLMTLNLNGTGSPAGL